MPDAPSRVFEANARLHVGVLCVTSVMHAYTWSVAGSLGTATASGFHFLCSVVMLLGRLHVWRTGQCRAWHATATNVWCVVVSACYLGAAASGDVSIHLNLGVPCPFGSCVVLLLCTLAGVLHSSLGPSSAQSIACASCMAFACASVLVQLPDAQALLFVLSTSGGHVLGATLSAEIYAQSVRIVRFEDTIEQQSCRQERTDYDLALSLKDAKKARRALDEVIRTVHAFEQASAPKPIRRVRRATPVVVGKPLFVLADGAIQLERLRAQATTTHKLDEVKALEKEIDHQLRGYDTDTDEEHETPDEQLQLPNVLARVKAAATPLSVAGSLRSTDDSPVVARRWGSYEEAEKEYKTGPKCA